MLPEASDLLHRMQVRLPELLMYSHELHLAPEFTMIGRATRAGRGPTVARIAGPMAGSSTLSADELADVVRMGTMTS